MASGRQGLAAATAIDPVSATTHYVYALLGKSGPVTALTSYEYLTVSIAANGRQIGRRREGWRLVLESSAGED